MAFTRFTDHQRITLATVAHLVVPARTPLGAYATKFFLKKSSFYLNPAFIKSSIVHIDIALIP